MAANVDRCAPAQLQAALAAVSRSGVEVVAQTCKLWPYDPGILLSAVASNAAADARSSGERRLLLDVLMLDATTGGLLAHHRREIEEDAAMELSDNSLRLDTARYDLTPATRAVGVVVTSAARGPSCPDMHASDELTLFVREGRALRPVLATFLGSWQALEGDVCSVDGGARVTESARTHIVVENLRQHGFADLTLSAQVTRAVTHADGDETSARRIERRRLRYDGSSYTLDPYRDLFFWSKNQ